MKLGIAIPARLESSRLPEKLLQKVCGKYVLEYVVDNLANDFEVNILTDSEKIIAAFADKKCHVIKTPSDCKSGTERIYSVLDKIDADFIINVQGDEPLMKASYIKDFVQWVKLYSNDIIKKSIFTAGKVVSDIKEYQDINKVKVVRSKSGRALYFSRSPIPFYRDAGFNKCLIHYGIYGYHKDTLKRYYKMESKLEDYEKLEQLRFLENDGDIYIQEVEFDLIGIDVKKDLENFEQYIKSKNRKI